MRSLPTLAASMTAFPHALDADASLDEADAMMATHDIRHLPVTHAGALVGVLARTDVLAARVRGESRVEPVYTREPYVVEVHTPLEEVARDYAGRVQIAKVNVDDNQATAAKYGIRGIPTLMLFKNGAQVATKVGALSKSQLTVFLDSHL